ncbi:3-hydroxyacyl-CoA dehydrogenase/enoyl-CoA hydratase family protein [Xanthobacter autotrophicus]|uniref:3-hydroxyacyl-CoA dehydrogenase/enoyl-CoA hydratase family protein n=1 Tax=Xanthobacter autotrophicus TaxID=280 RepID=UPI00372885DE
MTMSVQPEAVLRGAHPDKIIAKAAVIGAGSMGAGIAAQFANAGVPVVLLDIPAREGPRDGIARSGVERQLKAGGFMHPDAARLVTTGNTEDDLALLADADWIVEAVIENLAIKQDLFRRIETVRKAGAAVSSNTSTIRRADIVAGLGEAFDRAFVITHFFNPPRHMRLVEIVSGPDTAPEILARVERAADIHLGKAVVSARDTPGFIANRIGCYWMAVAALEAIRLGLTVEEADAVLSRPFGIPKTGIFGLFDLVGIDLVPHVWKSLEETLPANDDLQNFRLTADPIFSAMIARGRFGRKTKAGFYRLGADRSRQVIDFAALDYRPEAAADLAALKSAGRDLAALISDEGKAGAYAWSVLSRVVAYAAAVGPEIAGDVAAIDTAMKLGYAWSEGPFELGHRVGADAIAARLAAEGRPVPQFLAEAAQVGGFYLDGGSKVASTAGGFIVPEQPAGVISLAAVKRAAGPVIETAGAALWDLGDGVGCFTLKTKMNVFEPAVFEALERTVADGPKTFRALVIGNDDPRSFSAGANLGVILQTITAGDFAGLDAFIARGQAAFHALKYSPFPVVGAVFGLALGGGCEVLLHCGAIVAHAELNAGLPEVKVGLVPAWGGCTQLLARFGAKAGVPRGPLAPAAAAFQVIASGAASTSAATARDLAILRDADTIVMNRDRLLGEAKAHAIALAEAGYAPPEKLLLALSGPSGKASLMNIVQGHRRTGAMTEADEVIAEHIATVLTGAVADPLVPLTEEDVMRLEREALVTLAQTSVTRARIEHMLATGKPLRN